MKEIKINTIYHKLDHYILFFVFLYLGYVYFFDFNQGVSSAPLYIKGLKDILLLLFILLRINKIIPALNNSITIVFLIPLLLNTLYRTDLNAILFNRNTLYAILLAPYFLKENINFKKILEYISYVVLFLGFLLFPISPWSNQDMISTVGNPAVFYILMLLFLCHQLEQVLINKIINNKKLLLFILTSLSINLSGALAGQLLIYIIILLFFICQYKKKSEIPLVTNLKILFSLVISTSTVAYFFTGLFDINILKILYIKYMSFESQTNLTSASIGNREKQIELLSTEIPLINIKNEMIKSDFQFIEILMNLGIIPCIVIFGYFFISIYSEFKKDETFKFLALSSLFLSSVFSPIFRYIHISIITFYLLNESLNQKLEINKSYNFFMTNLKMLIKKYVVKKNI